MQPNEMQQRGSQMTGMTSDTSFGGHDILDAHEVIGSMIDFLDHCKLYESHIQDPQLKDIQQRQYNFLTELYNTVIDTFQSGKDPSKATHSYKMTQSNDVIYGMTQGQPKKPAQNVNELDDECISSFMMGHTKALASSLTMAAFEVSNPVLRRIFADSVPNLIEMGYELFLYQNKNGYYQVPQLESSHMSILQQSYTHASQPPLN